MDRIVGQMRTQLQDAWTEVRSGEGPVWRRKNFWLALAALFLPGGWLLLLVSLVPVRIRTERRS